MRLLQLALGDIIRRFYSGTKELRLNKVTKKVNIFPSISNWNPLTLSSIEGSLIELSSKQIEVFMLILFKLVEATRAFVDMEIVPIASDIDSSNMIPKGIWKKLGMLGIFGISASQEFGGLGMGYFEFVLVMEEISRGSGSLGLSFAVQSNFCINQIIKYGTPMQHSRYLPKLISGECIGAVAILESNYESDIRSMTLNATKLESSKGFVLNGTKTWVANGHIADVFVLFAKVYNSDRIIAFIVDKNSPGFSIEPSLDTFGMRGTFTSELLFSNCFISNENLLGTVENGLHILSSAFDHGRCILAGGSLGLMQSALEVAVPQTGILNEFNQRACDSEGINNPFKIGKIANAFTNLCASRAFVYNLSKAFDRGTFDKTGSISAVLFTSEKATEVALDAIQMLGGKGYDNVYPLGRILRDCKLYELLPENNDSRRSLIGREFKKLFPSIE